MFSDRWTHRQAPRDVFISGASSSEELLEKSSARVLDRRRRSHFISAEPGADNDNAPPKTSEDDGLPGWQPDAREKLRKERFRVRAERIERRCGLRRFRLRFGRDRGFDADE